MKTTSHAIACINFKASGKSLVSFHKKTNAHTRPSFPLQTSLVNVTKSAEMVLTRKIKLNLPS